MKNKQEKNNLTADEICSILTRCGETGVTKLQFCDLCVEFGPKAIPILAAPEPRSMDQAPLPFTETVISEIQKKEALQYLEMEELRTREDQIADALLEDPLGAEQLMVEGALEEPDNEPDGE